MSKNGFIGRFLETGVSNPEFFVERYQITQKAVSVAVGKIVADPAHPRSRLAPGIGRLYGQQTRNKIAGYIHIGLFAQLRRYGIKAYQFYTHSLPLGFFDDAYIAPVISQQNDLIEPVSLAKYIYRHIHIHG